MLDCVLFDLDGLLIDSEPLQFRSYQYAFEQFGVTLDFNGWIRWHSVESSTTRWIKDENLGLDPEEVRAVKKIHYDQLIVNELELKPGARAIVEACSKEFKLAVVSGSRQESIKDCLEKFDLHRHFSKFISGTEVTHSKPYPDCYLEAMKEMKTTPDTAIAIEDSVTGYRAARAAGLNCIVCPDHFIVKRDDAFKDATFVVESLHDLNIATLRSVHVTDRNYWHCFT